MKKWVLLLLSLVCFTITYAQRDGLFYLDKEYNEDPFDDYTYSFFGANYLSNNVYLGRRDTARLPYFTPYIGYQMHNGLYGKASASYSPVKHFGRFDLFTLELGYDRTFGKHILTGISVEKYFYYKKSPGIKSSIKDNITLYCLYKNEKIEPQLIFAVNQNKSNDYVVGFSLDHNIRLRDNTLNIYPTATFYYGSRHYFDDYYLNNLKRKDSTLTDREVVQNAGNYKPLNVEISARTTFRTPEWLFTLTPSYSVPISAATIKLPGRVATEKLKSSFYITLDVCYRHERK